MPARFGCDGVLRVHHPVVLHLRHVLDLLPDPRPVDVVGEGVVFVAKTKNEAPLRSGPAAPTPDAFVLGAGHARTGAAGERFLARLGGAMVSERAGIPPLSLAASEVILGLDKNVRARAELAGTPK